MRTEPRVPLSSERLAPEELDALRARLSDAKAPPSGLREGGAATLDDLAEALGVEREVVRRELDRIREDRAIRPSASGRNQTALLAFAMVLLVSAFVIHRLNPRRLSSEESAAEMEGRFEEIVARRKAHPVVHYPIVHNVSTGVRPPPGIPITVTGALTVTNNAGDSTATFALERSSAESQLTEAMLNALQVAREAERSAPPPTKPLPQPKTDFAGRPLVPPPGVLRFSFYGSGGPYDEISAQPAAGVSPDAYTADVRRRIAFMAKGCLDGLASSQAFSLKNDPRAEVYNVMPPAGYQIQFQGYQNAGSGTRSPVVLPYDPDAVKRKLERALRTTIWRDAAPSFGQSAGSPSTLAKRPIPAFGTVTIQGPSAVRTFRIPLTASPGYPTAADAARAADRIIAEALRKAADEVRSPRIEGRIP